MPPYFHPRCDLRRIDQECFNAAIESLESIHVLFDALFDGVEEAVFLVAADHTVLAANTGAQTLLESSAEGLVGQKIASFFPSEEQPKIRAKLSSLMEGTPRVIRRSHLSVHNSLLPVQISLRRMDLHDTTMYQIIARDLSTQTTLEKGLRRKRAEVEGMNLALRNVVRSTEQEKKMIREQVLTEIREDLMPALDRLAQEDSAELRKTLQNLIHDRIYKMTSGASKGMSPLLLKLTPREIEICKLVRLGSGTKDIAELLNASFETIQTHRKNIRRKLGLRCKGVSLFAFLHQQEVLE
jgi:PAS domain S-box-containing protein